MHTGGHARKEPKTRTRSATRSTTDRSSSTIAASGDSERVCTASRESLLDHHPSRAVDNNNDTEIARNPSHTPSLPSRHREAEEKSGVTEKTPPSLQDTHNIAHTDQSSSRELHTPGLEGDGQQLPDTVQAVARAGTETPGQRLPHLGRIQHSFGRYDVDTLEAHTGRRAAASARALGARAYTTGSHLVFAKRRPDLYTVAHEAAHAIQQRAGHTPTDGIDTPTDRYERHAHRVARRVVRGTSAEETLERMVGTGLPAPSWTRSEQPVQRLMGFEFETNWNVRQVSFPQNVPQSGTPTVNANALDADDLECVSDDVLDTNYLGSIKSTPVTIQVDGYHSEYVEEPLEFSTPAEADFVTAIKQVKKVSQIARQIYDTRGDNGYTVLSALDDVTIDTPHFGANEVVIIDTMNREPTATPQCSAGVSLSRLAKVLIKAQDMRRKWWHRATGTEMPATEAYFSPGDIQTLVQIDSLHEVGPTFRGFLALVSHIIRRGSRQYDADFHFKKIFDPLLYRTRLPYILTRLVNNVDYPSLETAIRLSQIADPTATIPPAPESRLIEHQGNKRSALRTETKRNNRYLFANAVCALLGKSPERRLYQFWDRLKDPDRDYSPLVKDWLSSLFDNDDLLWNLVPEMDKTKAAGDRDATGTEHPIFEMRGFSNLYLPVWQWSDWAIDMWQWLVDQSG